ncbi:MAG: signal peptidase I [Bacteroidales bacterium]|jgi:signal peptidase I|nr:signal peptidase I [Bacteroidales bacterium]
MSRLKRFFKVLLDVLYYASLLLTGYCVWVVFFAASFSIPTGSMEPTLTGGDRVLVWKPAYGARIFNLSRALNGERVRIYRVPGYRRIRHNDVVVLHNLHPYDGSVIDMHLLKYLVKRCIGLPGDTLEIRDCIYRVQGYDGTLGNVEAQQQLAKNDNSLQIATGYLTFPFDSALNWNVRNFGPLYIPRKNDRIPMNRENFLLYRKLIAWEQQCEPNFQNDTVYINNQPVTDYCFLNNYYFMAGDRTENSVDSRYWGLAPEEYIVGKVACIWKSLEPTTGKFRWNRFLKRVQ